MQPTYQQVRKMLHHPDSPFIQVIGILYVRYVIDAKEMWSFFEELMADKVRVLHCFAIGSVCCIVLMLKQACALYCLEARD